jgi:hypothetical protein
MYLNPVRESKQYQGLSCSSDGKYILAVTKGDGEYNKAFLSKDYGNNWIDLSNSTGIIDSRIFFSCNVSSTGQYMILGTNGAPVGSQRQYTSSDYGSSWIDSSLSTGDRNGQSLVTISDDGKYAMIATSSQVYCLSGNIWVSTYNSEAGAVVGTTNAVTSSSNGKYVCTFRGWGSANIKGYGTFFRTSIDYGKTWTDTSVNQIDASFTYIIGLRLSSTGNTIVVIGHDVITNEKTVYISRDFMKSKITNGVPTWKKTNFPTLKKYKSTYFNTKLPLYNKPDNTAYNNSDISSSTINYSQIYGVQIQGIALSSNGQHIRLIVQNSSTSRVKEDVAYDADIFISNDFGNSYVSMPYDITSFDTNVKYREAYASYHSSGASLIDTSRSGAYNVISLGRGGLAGTLSTYIVSIYTYSYTPIKISYNNTFDFTFTSTLYDCSGTYYLKNENNEILSTKVIDVSYTTSITFTDIRTSLFNYGNSQLFVYKSDIVDLGDIQISDPMVVNATCFLEGTKILAMDKRRIVKYIPIEKLKPGMLVKTLLSGFVPIKYIGYSTLYNPGLATRVRDQLFIYKKSASPELREDLVLTGNHSVLVDTITDEQRQQITETLGDIYETDEKYRLPAFNDKRAEPYDQRGDFRIWNLALENENYYENYGIYANGLLVETTSCRYLKEISRMTLVEKE